MFDTIAEAAATRPVLVHLDADLYSSALHVLATLAPRLPSFWCLFDEFSGHERRALFPFVQPFGARCSFHRHLLWRREATAVLARVAMPASQRVASHPTDDRVTTPAS